MAKQDVDQQFTRESILKVISNELAGLDLSPGDYIQVANSILDSALGKNPGASDLDEIYGQGDAGRDSGSNGNEALKSELNNRKITGLPIVTDDISIRACEPESDFDILKKWSREERGREFLLSRLENNIEKAEEVFFNRSHLFGMVCNAMQEPIGVVGFLNYDRQHQKAELRKLIGESTYRGKGLGKKASRLWVGYGLTVLNLRKIYLYTFDSNLRNIRINEELGFRLEGVFREEHIIDGRPKDILRMSLIRSK